ncbi:retron St85 family RNA-directed DNA polymerase, partial [Vibrio cholerae]|nr:retron St85 family RNA-directed DNA polymerase [Vibrio cholerae]
MNILTTLREQLLTNNVIMPQEFERLEVRGSHAYKVYSIPKRKAGRRTIAHPSSKLKICQRHLNAILNPLLKVHDSSYAYVKGRSIKDNALVHSHSAYVLKMDFQNFFNSITPTILRQCLIQNDILLSVNELEKLEQLIFWNPSKKRNGKLILSVGSPISPLISNAIMYPFDKIINDICTKHGINYTRYADDITFSTNIKNTLNKLPEIVEQLIIQTYAGRIIINKRKTVFSSKKHNRHVTGITLTNDSKISIGRSRKRYISSLVFKYINKNLDI